MRYDCSGCGTNDADYQQWPKNGKLKENMNKSLNELKKIITYIDTSETEIFMHKMKTIRKKNEELIQTGSAPNFQGGLITQCTCKPFNRACKNQRIWENRWIAGFTDNHVSKDKKYLFYLMKVEKTYKSQRDIWDSLKGEEEIRKSKNSRFHKFGDFYQPQPYLSKEYNHNHYYEPEIGHPHRKDKKDDRWIIKDIEYKRKCGKRPLLLVGNPDYSFLWSKPLIYWDNPKAPRTKTEKSMSKFFGYLKDC